MQNLHPRLLFRELVFLHVQFTMETVTRQWHCNGHKSNPHPAQPSSLRSKRSSPHLVVLRIGIPNCILSVAITTANV